MKAELILGPPGTGKTTHLEKICAKHKGQGKTLFVSHTKAAAKEARSRIGVNNNLEISTIHSLAYRMADISKEQVVDHSKLKEFGNKAGFEIRGGSVYSDEGIAHGDELLAIHSLAVNSMNSRTQTYMNSHRPLNVDSYNYFHRSYEKWKKQNGYVDFNDMLLIATVDRPVANFRYNHIIIDEGQDLSKLQWMFLSKIFFEHAENVYVAGDDDQAIYTWGGADPGGMQRFQLKTDAKIITLDQSYRLPQKTKDLADSVIKRISNRYEKPYKARTDTEGKNLRYGDIQYICFDDRDTLVLYRNHMYRKEIETELINNCVPYVAESGMPGLFNNKWAKMIRNYQQFKKGEKDLTMAEINMLSKHSRITAKKLFDKRDFDKLPDKWFQALDVPENLKQYYMGVDLFCEPNVRLSSIHGSKGREADRVILHTGLTQRTIESMNHDPDAETRVFYVAVTRTKQQLDIIEADRGFPI